MPATSHRQEAPDTFIGCIHIDRTHGMHEMLMTDGAFIFLAVPKDEARRVYLVFQLDDEQNGI